MTITGSYQDYSKDQLIKELQELHLKYDDLNLSREKDLSEIKLIEANLRNRSKLFAALNQYAIKVSELEGEMMYQFIVSKFKELFEVRAVWISSYCEKNSELVIEASTASEEDNSLLVRYLGKAVKHYHTSINDENRKLMVETGVKSYASLNELSFGQIPDIIGSTLEKLIGAGWFQGVSLINQDTLFGSLVIAGYNGQEQLQSDIVSVFAELTSHILRRKKIEAELKFSEDKFRKAFYTSPDSININRLDDGMFVSVNSGFLKITGYSEEEVIGKSSLEINIWANPADREKLVKGLSEKGEVENMEATFLMKNGSVISGIMSASLIDLEGITHILSISRNISDRKEAEKALIMSENKYRELIELAVDGILIGSPDGTIIGANSYMVSLAGRSLKDMLGMHVSELFETESLAKSPLMFNLLKKGETIINERNILLPDKSLVPIEMHSKMMPDGTYHSIFHDISERRKADLALRKSEEKLQSIIQVAPVGIGLVADRILMEVNDYLCNLIGYTRSELIGKSSLIMYPSMEEFIRVGKIKYNQISINGTGTIETIFKCKDSHLVNVILSSTPLDKNDYSKGVTFTVLDITERKKAELALRESEGKFRSIAENLSDVIFLATEEGIIRYISPASGTLGYSSEDCVGKFFGDFVAEGELEKATNAFKNALNLINVGKSASLIMKRKDGSNFFAELTSSFFMDGNEKPGILGLLRDITSRKMLEDATIESEKRYRELFQNNPIPTYIFDEATLEFVEVNDATVENYGYSREEFASMTLKDLRISDDIPDLLASLENIGEDVFYTTNMRHKRKNGHIFPVEITSHALPEKNGRKTRLVVASDITERIKAADQMNLAREKAEASDRLKTIFLNNISHEVRTPLNGILGFAELISREDISNAEKNEALEMVYESSDRLLKTITNYMDISLLTSGSFSVNLRELNPSILINSLYNKYKSVLYNQKIDLSLKIPDSGLNISLRSDPEILEKILTHLMDNAVKFTEKGSILLGYEIKRENIEFYVKDTGIGISERSVSRIFDRFVKADIESDRISEGSGLGLAIVKGLSELIGGTIRVNSEPGKGSSFFITLLLSEPIVNKLTEKPAKSFSPSDTKNTILIAEDDEINFFYMNALLARETDSIILHARNGRDAIELFKANSDINLILMDIKMPEIDGLEATRQIKLINPDIPVIAITAYAMSGDEERVLAAGCDGYLSKPITKEKLLTKMAEFVSA